ncbi:hypothetical protein C8A05DRAFT_39688 [Staphylotrichum tortipilum]|uniref:Uncharacterized protein n=1 Tax=Staphylotrichum tortipilum TaxID=2831512 RepID=A0AAN6RN96_9PEZI|nr:hypothetical protein C8A05DRAFT_39688 [Staphylotrichum longicolle]
MASFDPNGYMQYDSIRDYYARLTNNSQSNVLNHLWFNILREYFPVQEGFGLEIRPRVTEHDDITIQYVKALRNDLLSTRMILALDEHLTECMQLARNTVQAEGIFGIATVGHYSRFYIMDSGADVLSDHPATMGKALEYKTHESQIVELLLAIKAEAMGSDSSS